jgi:acyl carrier protein
VNEEEALAWIAEVFEEPLENIKADTPGDAIAGWDSLGVLTLMAGLDEKFDIRITEKELNELQLVGDILALLVRYGKITTG